MKKIILAALMIAGCSVAYSQPSSDNHKTILNSDPAYPFGEQALYDAVMHHVAASEEAMKKFSEGEVSLSFEIRTDSTVANAMVLKGVGEPVDNEVKTFVEKLKFAPAIQNGRAVKMNVMYTFSVRTIRE